MISYMEVRITICCMAKQEKTPFMVTKEMISSMQDTVGTLFLVVTVVIQS